MKYNYTDPYLLKLIEEAMEREAVQSKKYTQMAENENPENNEIYKKIAMDEQKHFNMLKEIYTTLNNTSVTPVTIESVPSEDIKNHKKALINDKINNIELYRTLYFNLKQPQYKNYAFEIMSDEQKHAIMLNEL